MSTRPGHADDRAPDGPTDLPAVGVADVTVHESDADQQVSVPVVLSHASPVPVTVNLDTGVDAYDDRVPAVWVPVTVPDSRPGTEAPEPCP